LIFRNGFKLSLWGSLILWLPDKPPADESVSALGEEASHV
jgi:hypothetical protein